MLPARTSSSALNRIAGTAWRNSRDPSRTAREPTHQVRHTTGPGAERAPRSGEADDYADDDGDDDARLH
jgi:hypothetical protein